LYSERDLSGVASSSMAAKTDFEDTPEIPAHSMIPMKFRLLNPVLADTKGILRMDIYKLPKKRDNNF
jgi:hypothetical protein